MILSHAIKSACDICWTNIVHLFEHDLHNNDNSDDCILCVISFHCSSIGFCYLEYVIECVCFGRSTDAKTKQWPTYTDDVNVCCEFGEKATTLND